MDLLMQDGGIDAVPYLNKSACQDGNSANAPIWNRSLYLFFFFDHNVQALKAAKPRG